MENTKSRKDEIAKRMAELQHKDKWTEVETKEYHSLEDEYAKILETEPCVDENKRNIKDTVRLWSRRPNGHAVSVSHVAYLSMEDEQRFAHAVIKWAGTRHGAVTIAIHEAIMDWIKRVEAEEEHE